MERSELEKQVEELLRGRKERAVIAVDGEHLGRRPPLDHRLKLVELQEGVGRAPYAHAFNLVKAVSDLNVRARSRHARAWTQQHCSQRRVLKNQTHV
ncbi:hypothetical protein ACLOJK_031492 [Asimina triloba]